MKVPLNAGLLSVTGLKKKLDDTAFEEALSSQKSPLWNQIRATDAKWARTPTFVVFTQHAGWKIIAPQVNQTGEVRLLSKLLNQKVDTECCVCSGEKTLTVQGLWVCKKTESLGEMHLQAPELLTFGYAYETVLAQSKQKKKKRLKQCCVDGRWYSSSHIYKSCQAALTNMQEIYLPF